jgi:hypothetical protein
MSPRHLYVHPDGPSISYSSGLLTISDLIANDLGEVNIPIGTVGLLELIAALADIATMDILEDLVNE